MRVWLALLAGASLASASSLGFVGYVGGSSPSGDWDPVPAWSVHALYRFDRMVAFGLGGGYLKLPGTDATELSGRLQVRLPLGRALLPYLEGEAGAAVRPVLEDSRFHWRFGGGGDLKLGDRSSLLVSAGWQAGDRVYSRLGLLLEL